jgi:hypothetical protein
LPTVVFVESTVIPLASAVLMLSLSVLGLHPVALTTRPLACYELPANIRTTPALRGAIMPLLARSPTLRAQCARIAAAPRTYVSIDVSAGRFSAETRARSTARRYPSGVLFVDVEIPVASQDFAELVAHELEHVTEFIDRVDFKALAQSRESGIVQCTVAGAFESLRAQQAGRAAAAEIDSHRGATELSTSPHEPVRSVPSLPVTRWR